MLRAAHKHHKVIVTKLLCQRPQHLVIIVQCVYRQGELLTTSRGEEGGGGDSPVRKGRSSLRVRSSPSAKAMVDSFFMEFSRSCVVFTRHGMNVYVCSASMISVPPSWGSH